MYQERYPKIFPLDWALPADEGELHRPHQLPAAQAIDRFFSEPPPPGRPAGIYVHIPFCLSNCYFCCFSRIRIRDYELVKRYVAALKKEIRLWSQAPWVRGLTFDTLYFGGGTPSVLGPAEIDELLQALKAGFNLAPDLEFSFEGAPATISDPDKLQVLKAHGCTRVSMGVQTFDGKTRRHLGLQGERPWLDRIIAGLQAAHSWDVSIDLLYGYPGQSRVVLAEDVRHAIELGLVNLDCYDMMNSPLDRLFWAEYLGEVPPRPDWQIRYQLAEMIFDLLEGAGYQVDRFWSEFYRPGHACRYKQTMFSEIHDLLPLGTSGAGSRGNARLVKEDHLLDYLQDLERDRLPVVLLKEPADLPGWKIMHGLVLLRIDPERLRRSLGDDPLPRYRDKLNELVAKGLLEQTDGTYRATRAGKLWIENVALEFASPKFSRLIGEQLTEFEKMKERYPAAGVTAEELWRQARQDMGIPVDQADPGAAQETLPIQEVQAYIDIKMTRSLNYLVELFRELRQRIPEAELAQIVRQATNKGIPPAKRIMEQTAHLFMKYIRSGRWPEFMKGEEFIIEEQDGVVTVTIPRCVLRPYRTREPFICLNEHEFVKELLRHYKGFDVEDDYLVEQTFNRRDGDHVCRLRYRLRTGAQSPAGQAAS